MTLDGLGETGVPGDQLIEMLSKGEISTMQFELAEMGVINPIIVDDIIFRSYEIRGWDKLRQEAEPRLREHNLKRSLDLAIAGDEPAAARVLSSKNRYALNFLRKTHRSLSFIDAIHAIKANLPKRGRGRSPANGRHATAVYLANLLEAHGYSATTNREGLFVRVLALVFSIASGEQIEGPHHVAERALRNRATFVDGVMEIPVNR